MIQKLDGFKLTKFPTAFPKIFFFVIFWFFQKRSHKNQEMFSVNPTPWFHKFFFCLIDFFVFLTAKVGKKKIFHVCKNPTECVVRQTLRPRESCKNKCNLVRVCSSHNEHTHQVLNNACDCPAGAGCLPPPDRIRKKFDPT